MCCLGPKDDNDFFSFHCTTSREIIQGVSYQLVTVRLPSVSVGRVAILVSNHSVVLDSFPVDN